MITPYTLSLHSYAVKHPDNHLDLFLDVDGFSSLITYKLGIGDFKEKLNETHYSMYLSNSHRRVYLSYQGKINMGRGRVRILRKGHFQLPKKFDIMNPMEQILFPRLLCFFKTKMIR